MILDTQQNLAQKFKKHQLIISRILPKSKNFFAKREK